MEHQPHPPTPEPAWAKPSAEYLAKHANCNHAWGTCTVSNIIVCTPTTHEFHKVTKDFDVCRWCLESRVRR